MLGCLLEYLIGYCYMKDLTPGICVQVTKAIRVSGTLFNIKSIMGDTRINGRLLFLGQASNRKEGVNWSNRLCHCSLARHSFWLGISFRQGFILIIARPTCFGHAYTSAGPKDMQLSLSGTAFLSNETSFLCPGNHIGPGIYFRINGRPVNY